jgi:enoyl-CoA hydratase/carnithine racemase
VNLENVLVSCDGDVTTITMNRPGRRNALSHAHLRDLLAAFTAAAASDATGLILAGAGPVFSAGHDFADIAGAEPAAVRSLLDTCVQLVATCDLAVAARSAGFAAPGGKGGWFCHTPMVAIARDIGRKHAAELAYTGDVITADKALEWGLVNQVVPDADLDTAVADLLARATRGSRSSKALGKLTLHQQLAMSQDAAYQLAVQVMADSSQTAAAQEGMTAFLEKRSPRWPD